MNRDIMALVNSYRDRNRDERGARLDEVNGEPSPPPPAITEFDPSMKYGTHTTRTLGYSCNFVDEVDECEFCHQRFLINNLYELGELHKQPCPGRPLRRKWFAWGKR